MTESLLYMVNNLTDENMALRRDGVKLKLVMSQIIEDLEKAGGNEKYIQWIKENCNIELYNSNDIEELKYINRKRTMDYINKQRIIKEALHNATHSIEYNTILKLANKLGIDLK